MYEGHGWIWQDTWTHLLIQPRCSSRPNNEWGISLLQDQLLCIAPIQVPVLLLKRRKPSTWSPSPEAFSYSLTYSKCQNQRIGMHEKDPERRIVMYPWTAWIRFNGDTYRMTNQNGSFASLALQRIPWTPSLSQPNKQNIHLVWDSGLPIWYINRGVLRALKDSLPPITAELLGLHHKRSLGLQHQCIP